MKKVLTIMLLAAMLINVVACANCQSGTTSKSSGSSTITTITDAITSNLPSSETPTVLDIDASKLSPITVENKGEKVSYDNFTGSYEMTNAAEPWQANTGIDYSGKNIPSGFKSCFGTGSSVKTFMEDNKYSAQYYVYDVEKNKYNRVSSTEKIQALGGVIGYYGKTAGSSFYKVYLQQVEQRTSFTVSKVTAASGSFILVDYVTNLPGTFVASISDSDKYVSANASYSSTPTKVTENNLTYYKGTIKITVPYLDEGSNYKLSLFSSNDTSKAVASTSVTITEGTYADSPYHLIFNGDWDLVIAEGYGEQLISLFYNSYTKLIAR